MHWREIRLVKSEIGNPKSEANSKCEVLNCFEFRILDLFRISDFGFRISKPALRGGTSILEVIIVLTIIAILASMSVPSFYKGLEQSRANMAGAKLRAIWSAERMYWLEYRTYTTDLSSLQGMGLLDPTIVSGQGFYTYQISYADSNTFSATAARAMNSRWNGSFTIDDTGTVSGALQASGEQNIVPGFQ
jgi:Tfp pilus assembly protein PilE